MNKKSFSIKKAAGFILTIVFALGAFGRGNAQEVIKGLSYLDKKPIAITIQDGKIISVKKIRKLDPASENIYLSPGLIDNQVNGFVGVSFSSEGIPLTEEGMRKATQALWENGVTTYFPTVTTNSRSEIVNNFSILAKAKNDPSSLGSIPGFHLEGPYISPVDGYRGAHSLHYVRPPDWDEFMEFYKASDNGILTVTVAPEVEGGLDFIKKCTEKGIAIALGHHNASADIIRQAIAMGARTCTHVGNGIANEINRHVNPLWPQLSDDRLMISIICDGFHLRPEEINVFYKAKGIDRTIITSDVSEYAGMKPGIYKNLDGEDIELTPDGEVRYPAQKVLYSSASPVNKGVWHAMKVTGCSLGQAIQMASANPAKLYGLNDRGSLEPGKRADIILFTLGDKGLTIRKTIVAGKTVYEKQ
ncbi:MAG: amidohydrolase family protein [Chitinophagaceae bacterium]|nr:amidohydrolase family protein [Chitinophagaceae bacterium]